MAMIGYEDSGGGETYPRRTAQPKFAGTQSQGVAVPRTPPPPAPGPTAPAPTAPAPPAAPKTYQGLPGWDLNRLNDPNDKSGKYTSQRWFQDNGYGAGGDKAYGADAVRAFVAAQNGNWELGGSQNDPWARQTQAYLDTIDPGRQTRWQNMVRDSGPGGANGMAFENAETLPGDPGYGAQNPGQQPGIESLLPYLQNMVNGGYNGSGYPPQQGGIDPETLRVILSSFDHTMPMPQAPQAAAPQMYQQPLPTAPQQQAPAPMISGAPSGGGGPVQTQGVSQAPLTMDPFMMWLQSQGYGGQ